MWFVKKLLKLALIVGAIAAVSKLVTAKKAEWQGLSEAEVREKLDSQLPGKMPGEKRDAVAEKVVSKARSNVSKMRDHLAKGDTDALEKDLNRQSDRLDSLRGVLRKDDPDKT